MNRTTNRSRAALAAALALAVVLATVVWLHVGRSNRRPHAVVQRMSGTASALQTGDSVSVSSPVGIQGTVRTVRGTGVVGARVCATPDDAPSWNGYEGICTDSHENGAYVFSQLAPGRFYILASAFGFASGLAADGRPLLLASGEWLERVDIVLVEGGVNVIGTVVDATGGPVPHASVRLTRGPTPSDTSDVGADDAGRFAASIAEGPVTVTASSPGYASASVNTQAPSSGLVVLLVPGSTVEGHVVSAVDGQPVSNITVHAGRVDGPSAGSPASVSQSDGAFTIHGLTPGTYEIRAEGLRWVGGADERVELALLASVHDLVVRVSPALRVAGRVLQRSTGEPCARGFVSLADKSRRGSVSKIAADGQVELKAVLPGRYDVHVECAGAVLRDGPLVLDIAKDDVTDMVWKVDAGLGLAVRAVNAADEPVPGAQVRLEFPSDGGSVSSVLLTMDDKGRYDYPTTLEPGSHRLTPAGGYRGAPVTVELTENTRNTEVTLHLDGSGSIVVSVKTESGEAVDGLTVRALPRTVPSPGQALAASAGSASVAAPGGSVTGDGVNIRAFLDVRDGARGVAGVGVGGGNYKVGLLEAGRYVVRVDADDGLSGGANDADGEGTTVEVTRGVVNTTVVLDRGGTICGRVVDGAGQPEPDAWVSAIRDDSRSNAGALGPSAAPAGGSGRRVLTDTEGRFVLGNLASKRRFDVRAEQVGSSAVVQKGVAPGEEITLVLAALGKLHGTAVDAEGRPVQRFKVWAMQSETSQSRTAVIDAASGDWSVDGVPVGHVALRATTDDARIAAQQVDVAAGQTVDNVRLVFDSLQAR